MNNSVQIETEFTPNPHSLKFNLNRQLLTSGDSAYFASKEAAENSPLAKKLFTISNVEGVLIGQDFVTISRNPSVETWASIIPPVTKALKQHLESGEEITLPDSTVHSKIAESEVEKKIRTVLDQRIRPAVARDGGDIIFHGFKEGVVTLHLQGACSSCPSSTATLKAGVERMLREYIPEVKEVIQL